MLWLPQLHRSNGGALSDLVAKSSPALHEEARSAQLFGSPITPDTMVVQRDPAGLTEDEQKHVVDRALRIDQRGYPDLLSIAAAVPVLNTLGLLPWLARALDDRAHVPVLPVALRLRDA